MKKWLQGLAFAAALGMSAAPANAFLVDFTSTDGVDWLGLPNSTSMTNTVGGIDITITSTSGGFLFADSVSPSPSPPCGDNPLACDHDGVGITDDEITFANGGIGAGEVLEVTFSEAVDIFDIGVLDLFVPDVGAGDPEVAQYLAVSGSPGASGVINATQVAYLSPGFASKAVTLENLTKISFFTSTTFNSDFALAFLNVELTQGNIPRSPFPPLCRCLPAAWGCWACLGGAEGGPEPHSARGLYATEFQERPPSGGRFSVGPACFADFCLRLSFSIPFQDFIDGRNVTPRHDLLVKLDLCLSSACSAQSGSRGRIQLCEPDHCFCKIFVIANPAEETVFSIHQPLRGTPAHPLRMSGLPMAAASRTRPRRVLRDKRAVRRNRSQR